MKLVCPGCLAKYSVADEKVPAALERARCRKCGGGLALLDASEPVSVVASSITNDEVASLAPPSEEPEAGERRARRKQRDMFSPPSLAEISNEPKLAGQRNDTSVLFSLGALSKEAAEIERTPTRGHAEGDGSGLIDIRALSAAHGTKSQIPMPTVDDLVNLGGSGLTTSPLLTAPAMDTAASPVEAREGKRGVWIALAGGALFFLGAVVLAVVATRPSPEPARTVVLERDPTATPAPTNAVPTATPAPTAPLVVAPPMHDPEPAKNVGDPAKIKPIVGPKATVTTADPHGVTPPIPTTAPTTQPTAPPSSTNLPPFNRGEAAASLASIAVASCQKPNGPTGTGHVSVIFDPSGSVQSATVDQGAYVGTPVGGCIAGKFRGAHVPAFSGGPMRVGKSFTL